jgi:hypothetical protein
MTAGDVSAVALSGLLLAGAVFGSRTQRWGEGAAMSGRSSLIIRATFMVWALLLLNWRFEAMALPAGVAPGLAGLGLVAVVLSYRGDARAPK